MNNKIIELLYKSFDQTLTAEEHNELEQALNSSKELKAEKEQILKLRQNLTDSKVQSFKPFFAEKVMRNINLLKNENDEHEYFFNSLVNAFRPVAIAATVLLIVLMSYNIFKSGNFSLSNALAEPEITFEEVINPTIPLTLE